MEMEREQNYSSIFITQAIILISDESFVIFALNRFIIPESLGVILKIFFLRMVVKVWHYKDTSLAALARIDAEAMRTKILRYNIKINNSNINLTFNY